MGKIMGEDFSADRMAELFLAYLFKEKADNRHVRRVASWLGLLILGVEKIKQRWWLSHTRQLCFESEGVRYKARFSHKLGTRGGIQFVQIEAARGQPEIRVARSISNLAEAADFYLKPRL